MGKLCNYAVALLLGLVLVGVTLADDLINITSATQLKDTVTVQGKGTYAVDAQRVFQKIVLNLDDGKGTVYMTQTGAINPDWSGITKNLPKGAYTATATIYTEDKNGILGYSTTTAKGIAVNVK